MFGKLTNKAKVLRNTNTTDQHKKRQSNLNHHHHLNMQNAYSCHFLCFRQIKQRVYCLQGNFVPKGPKEEKELMETLSDEPVFTCTEIIR